MCSLTGNFSIIQYDDQIGMQDRTDPLSHDQGRRICRLLFQLPTKCDIRLIVQRRKAVIKNEDLRFLRNRPRNGKALLLPPDTFVPPCAIGASYVPSFLR